MDLGRRPEIDIPENAAQAPEVLIFEIGAVAPAEVLDRQHVLAGDKERREVELQRRSGILAHADEVAVDPDLAKGVHAVKGQQHRAARPGRGHGERAAVGIDGIVRVIGRHQRRAPGFGPRVGDVHVNRDAIALQLDVGRHRDGRPGLVAKSGFPEIRHAGAVVLAVMVFPPAVERAIEGRFHPLGIRYRADLPRGPGVRADDHGGVGRQVVAARQLGILPVFERARRAGAGDGQRQKQRRHPGRERFDRCHTPMM